MGELMRRPDHELRSDNNLADILADELERSVSWFHVRTALSRRVTVALWTLLICDLAVCVWLFAVRQDALRCTGRLCAAASFGGHPLLGLWLAGLSSAALLVLSVATRGLTCGGGPALVAVCGCAAVALVAISAPLLVLLALAMLVALVVAGALAVAAAAAG